MSGRLESSPRPITLRQRCLAVLASSGMLVLLSLGGSAGCASPQVPSEPVAPPPKGQRVEFVFQAPSGEALSSEQLRGRSTLVLLLTTFDLGSQLMAQRVNEALHTHKPRINVLGVVMEAPKYAELVEPYQQTLNLDYPLVLADHASLEGRGALGEVPHLPTLIVLDAGGREVSRFPGVVSEEQIADVLRRAERQR